MKKPVLPDRVRKVISRLEDAGYRADIVGGCVRDFLLGKDPSDYDITTSASPDEMREVFSDMRTVETGIKHGTLTVIVEGEPFEITTYRKDGDYKDHRHPESVTFTKRLRDDLSRRDFTMNAICYNERDGYTDLFSGMDDINASLIRAVGNAERRFDEDALRILRAIRFASVLGFEIEKETSAAAKKLSLLLHSVSGERIAVEWKKLLGGVDAYRIIRDYQDVLVRFLKLDHIVLPCIEGFAVASSEIRELSIFALSSPDPVSDFLSSAERMKYDNKSRNFGAAVLENLNADEVIFASRSDIKRLLMRLGIEHSLGIARLRSLLMLSDGSLEEKILDVFESGEAYRISDLKISGRELVSLGLKGASVGELLTVLLDLVIDGELENSREALLLEAEMRVKKLN